MDILFLREPEASGGAAEGLGSESRLLQELQDTLGQLKQALHAALLGSRSNSKEARQWLINSIAGLGIQHAATKRRRFTQFLPGGAACRGAEHQALGLAALQLLFEAAPAEVGALVAQDASLLRRFFKSDPKRGPLWFGHFSMEGMRRFKYGAAALAKYALTNRAEVWHLLAWQGRHPQAPVAVAQRTHYFSELDVPRTLRHLIRECPDFWGSREMRSSVETGAAQLLALDPVFWSRELLRWLEDRHSASGSRLYTELCRCLEAGPWRLHCQRLLQLLPQHDLLPFATGLLDSSRLPGDGGWSGGQRSGQAAGSDAAAPGQPSAWLVFRRVQWQSLDQLMLAAAMGCCLPLLLRLLRDEEMADEEQQVDRLVRQLLQLGRPPEQQAAVVAEHWQLRRRLRRQRSAAVEAELQELLLLHLFAAAFLVQHLSRGNRSEAEQLQQLLTASGLGWQLESPAGASSAHRQRSGKKRKHKKARRSKRSGKKRKRRSSNSSSSSSGSEEGGSNGSSCGDELDGVSTGLMGPHSGLFGGPADSEQEQWRWCLMQPQRGDDGSDGVPVADAPEAVSSLELVDGVATAAGTAYVDWLFAAS
ncbi:hypothetical protein CHLNCDRAFT_50380 [Chlorella variabilis]|uniref:Uncharacterized protein n=1 Tax=Chlorella variabilis TaxID=554065 RepID=E1Z635_CHLVA|nr:hypothetical protein CHLNCDRAFT_50380 [Chlorella variabilis]EFN58578.1 hypothetical protein CHLNCDRAFT_50380 [Chlorella variabilis]|eukprot:XP_005850680.1 hypothetical protein CHLNCDRAFT_50380 [Chlorella variabilis]